MQEKRRLNVRILALGILIAFAVIATTAVAQDTVQCPCERWYPDNTTPNYYGPGMMGGYYGYGMMDGYGPGYGMMGDAGPAGSGLMALAGIFFFLFVIVWFIAGILLVIWLLKQLQTGKTVP